MTQLSHLALLGLAKESTIGTYVAPTFFVPFLGGSSVEEVYTEIKDESYRANDSILQGIYQGNGIADWTIDLMAYPDITGHFLRAMIGPDTVVAGVSTTLSAGVSAGATTITTVASIAPLSYISIDTLTAQEYAYVTAVSGSGPYSLTVTTVVGQTVGLAKAHLTAVAVVAQSTHTFKQASTPHPSYSITLYDTTATIGYVGASCGDLSIKIDPKGAVMLNSKFKAFTGTTQSLPTATYTTLTPELGWAWTMNNAGATSTRGLMYDMNLKRGLDPINSSDGTISPREIFSGPLEADGTYTAIFENQLDMNLFINYVQTPTTATLLNPAALGGFQLALTTSKSGWIKGKRSFSKVYTEASFSFAGIFNTTDAGSISAVLSNYTATAY